MARDLDARFQSAAEYGDALAGFLFENELKATARDVAAAVRATKVERERASSSKDSLIHALVMDELARMCSLVEDELVAKPVELSPSKEMVDPADWTKDLLD